MKRRRSRADRHSVADLDITAFMNLMVILVPVLLLSLSLVQVAVVDLSFPALSDKEPLADSDQQLEVVILADQLVVNFPAGIVLRRIADTEQGHDYLGLTELLKQVKQRFAQKSQEKKEIIIVAQDDTDYQTLVSTMDAVRSYPAVVAASLVDAELFPEIALADAD